MSRYRPKPSLEEVIGYLGTIVCVLLIISFFVLMTNCSSTGIVTSPATPAPIYQLTLKGMLDGVDFTGFITGSKAPTHTITIASSDTIPYVIEKTCTRSIMHEKVISQGWFSSSKQWSYTYTESPTLEDTGSCPLRLCAYSSTVGAPPVQCAFIDFKNDLFQMPARNLCNGGNFENLGKMICHTQVGLQERVQFTEPMQIAPPLPQPVSQPAGTYWIANQCQGSFIDSSNMLFQYFVPTKECYLVFDTLKAPHRLSKLTVIPYDTPLPTGGN